LLFKKAEKGSLVLNIVAQIEEAIVDGTYRAGDKLPSLSKLHDILGASQGTLREAFRILAQKGLIEVKLGSKGGAYVKESNSEPVADGLALLIRQGKISYEDLAEFRKVVEAGLIRLVIQRATGKDLRQLKSLLLGLEPYSKRGSEGWSNFLSIEVRIRKQLIRISGNSMYETVLIPIHENIITYGRKLANDKETRPDKAFKDWCQIIEAISKGDLETAVSVTTKHIDRYIKVISAQMKPK
jgi:GntR family transcriptional regulator, transcriptional repressor for pyruvate dehydrogenase complex